MEKVDEKFYNHDGHCDFYFTDDGLSDESQCVAVILTDRRYVLK